MGQYNAYDEETTLLRAMYLLVRDDTEPANPDKMKYITSENFFAKLFGFASVADITNMADNVTLVDDDGACQFFDTNGSNRNVTLPAEGNDNHWYLIANQGSEILTVKNDLATTIVELGPDEKAILIPDGTNWIAFCGSPLGTKGDLYTYSTRGAPLAVGDDDDFLVADSGETTGLKWKKPFARVQIALIGVGSALASGDGIGDWVFDVPEDMDGWSLTKVQVSVTSASTSGLPNFQLHNVTQAVDMLSTAATIDENELSSITATTAPVVKSNGDEVVTKGDQIRWDCDNEGTATEGFIGTFWLEAP